ncbi:uncharacterized protein LOC114186099 isoform X1 [Vigna unguiculata]|uniref:uncharacterized protein LOC114186099 isoform X1 n=1 Tax=Vigna unguiculata TaxID=3917 RepID=UPI0010165158|nr:uncharacterized protein LOC114186099 isoform X1 [Vigna unguiculata]
MSIAESGSSVTVDHREGALNLQGLLTSPNFTGRQFSVYPFKVLFIWVMGKKCLSLSWQDFEWYRAQKNKCYLLLFQIYLHYPLPQWELPMSTFHKAFDCISQMKS